MRVTARLAAQVKPANGETWLTSPIDFQPAGFEHDDIRIRLIVMNEPLNTSTNSLAEPAEPEAEASSVDLPAFLSGDEEASDEDPEPLPAIAAE